MRFTYSLLCIHHYESLCYTFLQLQVLSFIGFILMRASYPLVLYPLPGSLCQTLFPLQVLSFIGFILMRAKSPLHEVCINYPVRYAKPCFHFRCCRFIGFMLMRASYPLLCLQYEGCYSFFRHHVMEPLHHPHPPLCIICRQRERQTLSQNHTMALTGKYPHGCDHVLLHHHTLCIICRQREGQTLSQNHTMALTDKISTRGVTKCSFISKYGIEYNLWRMWCQIAKEKGKIICNPRDTG